jgi:WD40 repeat protein
MPLEGHFSSVTAVAFGAIDGAPVVISGSGDKTLRLWDARSCAPIGVPLQGHSDRVTCVALGAVNGAPIVVSGSWDNTVRLWDVRRSALRRIDRWLSAITAFFKRDLTGAPIGATLEGQFNGVTIRERNDVLFLVPWRGDKTIDRWLSAITASFARYLTGAPIGPPLEGHSDVVAAVAFGEIDGAPVVVSGSSDTTLRLWDARSGAPIGMPLEGHSSSVTAVVFGAIDGAPVVVSGGEDGVVCVWDLSAGDERAPVRCEVARPLFDTGIDNDGLIFAGTARGLVCLHVYRLGTQREFLGGKGSGADIKSSDCMEES